MNILYKEINKRTAEVVDIPNVTIKELLRLGRKNITR